MKVLGIIPARYASTRFPGKPLVVIHGKTMIRRVFEQAGKCPDLDEVVVATDHQAIFNHVEIFGGKVVMTSPNHGSGTERCREVLHKLGDGNFDCVVNIQGDEPCIDPAQITQVVECLRNSEAPVATLVKKITNPEDIDNPNVVKAVFALNGRAMYFSRSPIPMVRGVAGDDRLKSAGFFKHIGIYAYRSDALDRLVALPPGKLETTESLEQLRWMEHGYLIQTQVTEFESIAIDVPEDVLKIPAGV